MAKPKPNKAELLKQPITSTSEGAKLAKLWRIIVRDLNIAKNVEYLVTRYADQGKQNSAIKRKTKSSMMKNITDEAITWKTFLDIMFNVLRVKKMTITVSLEHESGSKTLHSLTILSPKLSDKSNKGLESGNQQSEKK